MDLKESVVINFTEFGKQLDLINKGGLSINALRFMVWEIM